MNYLLGFEDDRALSPSVVGQKFFQLAKAARAGFAVPRAVAISTAAHQYYLTHGRWPNGLLDDVLKVASNLDLSNGLSIRSSATLEDLEKQSFAGQYRTFLQVGCKAELKDKDEEKKIWLLQSRTITTLDQQRWPVPPGIWTRKIANDLWADRLTPFLSNEMVQNAHQFDLSRTLKILGIPVARPTLTVVNGYLYVNCRSIADALAYIPSRLRLPDLQTLFPPDFSFEKQSAPSRLMHISVILRSPALLLLEPGIIPFVCIWMARRTQKKINNRLNDLQQQTIASAQQASTALQLSLASLRRLQMSNQWPYFFANYLTWLLRWLMVDLLGYSHGHFLEVISQNGKNTTIEIERRLGGPDPIGPHRQNTNIYFSWER